MTGKVSLYFTRLTVSEDGIYFPSDDAFRKHVISHGRTNPKVQEILDGYRQVLDVDLFEELETSTSGRADKRAFETGIYAAAAHFCECVGGINPTCLAFYSSGVTPALLFSGMVSTSTYLQKILPFNDQNREKYAPTSTRPRLAQVRFEGQLDDDVESFVGDTIKQLSLQTRVYLKDRRHHHTTLIGGEEAAVLQVREAVCGRFPSVAQSGAAPRLNIGSAHLPFYDSAPLVRMLNDIRFSAPRFRIVGPTGDVIPAGCTDQNTLRNLVIESAIGLLDTGRAIRTAAQYADRQLVIGSQLGARLLVRTSIGGFPKPELVTDLDELDVSSRSARSQDRAHLPA